MSFSLFSVESTNKQRKTVRIKHFTIDFDGFEKVGVRRFELLSFTVK